MWTQGLDLPRENEKRKEKWERAKQINEEENHRKTADNMLP